MKNTAKLNTTKYDHKKTEIKNNIEETTIQEHLNQSNLKKTKEEQKTLTQQLIQLLSTTKKDGERTTDYEERLIEDVKKTLKL